MRRSVPTRRPFRLPMRSWDLLARSVLGALEERARSRGLRLGDTTSIDLRQAIVDQGNAQGVPPAIALAVAMQESGITQWRADGSLVTGDNGASIGIFQVQQASAPGVDLTDPLQNIQAGVRYLRQMYDRYGDWPTAIGAYNMGPKNADYNVNHGVPVARWKNFAKYIGPVLAAAGVGSIVASAQPMPQTFAPDNPSPGPEFSGAQPGANNSNVPVILAAMAATALGVQWLLDQ